MEYVLFAPGAVVLAVNIAVAGFMLSAIGILIGKFTPSTALPLRHALLCLVVILTLISPAPLWFATGRGQGLVMISLTETNPGKAHGIVSTNAASNRSGRIIAYHGESDSRSQPELPTEPTIVNSQSATGTNSIVGASLPGTAVKSISSDGLDSFRRPIRWLFGEVVGSLAILIWAVVALWYTIRLGFGLLFVWRLRQSFVRSTDLRLLAAARQALLESGYLLQTEIFESPLIHAPLALGWWRPAVAMPRGLAEILDDDQLACLLNHEVAHIVRRDTVIALLQQFAAALFWWNPLLRIVNRQINHTRERLCDDYVVVQRGDGTPLAESIIRVAHWSANRTLPSPLALALLEDLNDLEDRIRRMTEVDCVRTIRLSGKFVAFAGAFALVVGSLLLLPIVRAQELPTTLKQASEAVAVEGEPAKVVKTDRVVTNDSVIVPPDKPKLTAPITVTGRVRTEGGQPVEGAIISLVSINGGGTEPHKTVTDVEGRYRFQIEPIVLFKSNSEMFPSQGQFQVFGEADGWGIAWHGMRTYLPQPRPPIFPKRSQDYSIYLNEPIEMDLTMRTAKSLTGRITDELGRPVANAEVNLRQLDYLDMDEREFHPNYREFRAITAASKRYHKTVTGDDGRFEFQGVPDETVATVYVSHPNFAKHMLLAAITENSISENRYIENSAQGFKDGVQVSYPMWATRKVLMNPLDLHLVSTRRVIVTIVQGEADAPVEHIKVSATCKDESLSISDYGETDEKGRIELKLPPGTYRLVADPPRVSEFVRSIGEYIVESEPTEQVIDMQLTKGCVLIFEAVDSETGEGISKVNFWEDFEQQPQEDGVIQPGTRGRRGVQSSTVFIDNPETDEAGEMRIVAPPGTRRYGPGFSPFPDGYKADPNSRERVVECVSGKTVRVKFNLSK